MKKYAILCCLLAAVFCLLMGCFSPWAGDEGTITISLGGSGNARALNFNSSFLDNPSLFSLLEHHITLTGPSGTINHTANGAGTVKIAVPPGLWNVKVETFCYGMQFAVGTPASIDVKAGQSNAVSVEMEDGDTIFYAVSDIITDNCYDWYNFVSMTESIGNHCAILVDDILVDIDNYWSPPFGTVAESITIIGNNKTITLTTASGTTGSLFSVEGSTDNNQTVTIKDLHIEGFSGNNSPLVVVENNGIFIIQGNSSLSGNSAGALDIRVGGTAIIDGTSWDPGIYYTVP